jgi:hypothetical protein
MALRRQCAASAVVAGDKPAGIVTRANSANRILAIQDVFTEDRLEFDCCFAKQIPVAAGLCYLRRGDQYLLLVQPEQG